MIAGAMTPREFLTELWGDPPPAPVYIYMLPTRQSIWFSHFENLDAAVAIHAEKDVYTSGGLGPLDNPDRASNRRVQQKDVAGIAGLWADIDVAHQVHGKKDLPQTVEQALGILELAEFQPTMLVNSGHGIQAWWLFTQPWLFNNTYEYWEARRLSSWWHDRIQALYQNEGCRIDSVHNLDRVMRIPGTWNNKIKTDVRPVRLMKNTGERFNLEEFLEMMPPDYQPRVMVHGTTPDGEVITGDNLMLDEAAEPPTMKLSELLAEDEKFRGSWNAVRPDWGANADRSPSAYDMSLASIAAHYHWTDQEIVDLLIANRRRHGRDLKRRIDYYRRTIDRARQDHLRDQALVGLTSGLSADEDCDEPLGNEERRKILADISLQLGELKIEDVIRYPGKDNYYAMMTNFGRVKLKTVGNILNPAGFQKRVADDVKIVLDIGPLRKVWKAIARGILRATRDEDLGEMSSTEEETSTWIHRYLGEEIPLNDLEEAATLQAPFIDEGGRVHISLPGFLLWAQQRPEIETHSGDFAIRLREIEATPHRDNVTPVKRRTCYRTWVLPPAFADGTQGIAPEAGESDLGATKTG